MKLLEVLQNKEKANFRFKSTMSQYYVFSCLITGKFGITKFHKMIYELNGSLEIFIPIIVITTFLSIPLTFMELGIAQFSSRGCVRVWDMMPMWRGISFAGLACLLISCLYNNILCSYFLRYAVEAIHRSSPWTKCGNQSFIDKGCYTFADFRSIWLSCVDRYDEKFCSHNITWLNSASFYWKQNIIPRENIKLFAIGEFQSTLIIYELFIVFLVYICIRNSVVSVEVWSKYLIIIPGLLHIVVFVMSFVHPGSLKGFSHLCTFKMANLLDINTWAVLTIAGLCGVGLGTGGLTTYACRSHFRCATNMQSFFLNLVSILYSVIYLLCFYNIMGILSYELNKPVDEIFKLDVKFSFIQATLAFSYWAGWPNIWTFFFFFTNFIGVLRNLVTECDTILTVLYQSSPVLRNYTNLCAAFMCVVLYALDVVCSIESFRTFLLQIDVMVCVIMMPILAFYVTFAVVVFYGLHTFIDDMHFMLGIRSSTAWHLSWYLSCFIYFFTFIWSCKTWKLTLYSPDPTVNLMLWVVAGSLASFPVIYLLCYVFNGWRREQKLTEMIRPAKNWGPEEDILRKSRDMFSAHHMTKEYLYRQKRITSKLSNPEASKPMQVVEPSDLP